MRDKTMIPRSCIPCEKIDPDVYDWYLRHAAKVAESKEKSADIIFIGDSITHFWNDGENISYGKEVWDEFFGDFCTLNLGFGFDRTQNMLWRLQHGEGDNQKPALIVLNAGTNQFSITENYSGDTPAEAFEGVKKLIQTIRSRWPEAELIVMAVFPRLPENPTQKNIDQLNGYIKNFLQENADPKIKFIDISQQLRKPDGSFNADLYHDRSCHPNADGYRIWARALMPEIHRVFAHE